MNAENKERLYFTYARTLVYNTPSYYYHALCHSTLHSWGVLSTGRHWETFGTKEGSVFFFERRQKNGKARNPRKRRGWVAVAVAVGPGPVGVL